MGQAALPLSIFQSGMSLYNAYGQSKAMKQQGKIEEQMAEQNARLLELQSEDAILRGDSEASKLKRNARFVKGSQRAGYAGQNVSVDTGTPASIQGETDTLSELDSLTIKNNAFREAWGYKTEAVKERLRGRIAKVSSESESRNTLLTGGLGAAQNLASGLYLRGQFKNTGTASVRNPNPVNVPNYMSNRTTSANKLNLY